jgi:hypothetical protein
MILSVYQIIQIHLKIFIVVHKNFKINKKINKLKVI